METNDRTQEAALLIAERFLLKQGWRFGPEDVGKTAREILDALSRPTPGSKEKS
jgi:hypothetical protein